MAEPADQRAHPSHEDSVIGWWSSSPVAQRTSLLRPLAILSERWKLLVWIVGSFTVASVALALILPKRYAAVATFIPDSSDPAFSGAIAGLAGQFGIQLQRGSQSPRFYASIAMSKTVLDSVLLMTLKPEATGEPGVITVMDFLKAKGTDLATRLDKGAEILRKTASASVNLQTNIVSLRVETKRPMVSAGIANRMLLELNRFNSSTLQTTARYEREFLENRSLQAERELTESEDSLSSFLRRNRSIAGAPELLAQQQRLQRDVDLKAQLYQTIRRQLEDARLREVNTTPVLTAIELATPPVRKAKPRRRRLVTISFFLGIAIASVVAFILDYLKRARLRHDPDFLALEQFWNSVGSRAERLLPRRHAREEA